MESISTSELENISADKIEEIGFSLIPSVSIFVTDFPIDEIHKIIIDSSAESIKLTTKKKYAVIARPRLEVLVFWITENLYRFIDLLIQGFNLSEISQKIDGLDLTEAMHFILNNRLIYKINY